MPVRLFVDTDINASLFLLVDEREKISRLRDTIARSIVSTNSKKYIDAWVHSIKVLFDPASPSRHRDNCYTVPDDYEIGLVADGLSLKIFAECSTGTTGSKRKREGPGPQGQNNAVTRTVASPPGQMSKKPKSIMGVAAPLPISRPTALSKKEKKANSSLPLPVPVEAVTAVREDQDAVLSGDTSSQPTKTKTKLGGRQRKQKKKKALLAEKLAREAFEPNDDENSAGAEEDHEGLPAGANDVVAPPHVVSSHGKDVSSGKKRLPSSSREGITLETEKRPGPRTAPYNKDADADVLLDDAQPEGQEEQELRAEHGREQAVVNPMAAEVVPPSANGDDAVDPLLPGQDQAQIDTASTESDSEEDEEESNGASSEEEEEDEEEDEGGPDPQRGQSNKPSGKFAEAGTGALNSLLRRVAAKNNANDGTNPGDHEEEGNDGGGAAAKNGTESGPASGGYQWQKSHVNYSSHALTKLTRLIVKDAINADRSARGLTDLAPHQMYKSAHRPDWWPLDDFSGSAFERKETCIKVYNAARKVMAAVHGVDLDVGSAPNT